MHSICETLKPAEPAGGQDERRISRAARRPAIFPEMRP